jgi:hypothetical protein
MHSNQKHCEVDSQTILVKEPSRAHILAWNSKLLRDPQFLMLVKFLSKAVLARALVFSILEGLLLHHPRIMLKIKDFSQWFQVHTHSE